MYRKEFGLSYWEFLAEPLSVYLDNMSVMSARSEIERAELKRMKRQARFNK